MSTLRARNKELENGKQGKEEVSASYGHQERVPHILRLPKHQATVNLVGVRGIRLLASKYEAVKTKAGVHAIKSLEFFCTIYISSGATILLHVH